jgi:hypothetical protein
MTIEAYTNGRDILFRNRTRRKTEVPAGAPPAYARSQLGPKTEQWLEARFPGISRNRVQRLADHERAAAERRV